MQTSGTLERQSETTRWNMYWYQFISCLNAVRRALFGAQAEVTQQPKVETYAFSFSEIIVDPYIALCQIPPMSKSK